MLSLCLCACVCAYVPVLTKNSGVWGLAILILLILLYAARIHITNISCDPFWPSLCPSIADSHQTSGNMLCQLVALYRQAEHIASLLQLQLPGRARPQQAPSCTVLLSDATVV